MSLSEFLTQIGAASVSTKVSLPREGLAGTLNALHERIEVEIQSVTDETARLLQENWPEFESELNRCRVLLERTQAEDKEVAELEQRMTGPNAFLPNLQHHLESHAQLTRSHHQTGTHLELLKALSSLHTNISTLSAHTTSGALPAAVSALHSTRQNIQSNVPRWITETEAWKSLIRWANEEDERLQGALVGALEACFSFEKTEGGYGKLVIHESVEAAPNGELLKIRTVLDTLDQLLKMSKVAKTIDGHLARISKQLLKYFIVPFLEGNQNQNTTLDFTYSSESRSHTVILERTTSKVTSPIPSLETFLTYFANKSTLLHSKFSSMITLNLTPSIQSHIIALHLHPSLPLSISAVDDYFPLLELATQFESTYLVQGGYLSFLPAGEERSREEGNVIQEWIERVDSHWAKAMGDQALDSIRVAIKAGSFEGEVVEIEVEDGEEWEEQIVEPIPIQEDSEEESEYEEYEEEEVIIAPPIREPTPPPIQTFGKKKLKATKITTAPPLASESSFIPFPTSEILQAPLIPTRALPPPIQPIVKPSSIIIPAPEVVAEEEDDPWGLSTSPVANSALPSPSSPVKLKSPISNKRTSGGLQPPVRSRTESLISSAGSEDAWGLGGDLDLDLDLDSEDPETLEVAEQSDIPEMIGGDDGWGFVDDSITESKGDSLEKLMDLQRSGSGLSVDGLPVDEEEDGWGFGEEEEDPVEEEQLEEATPMSYTIPLPSTPAISSPHLTSEIHSPLMENTASIPLIIPAHLTSSQHEKKESLGGWGWEGDELAPPSDLVVPTPSVPLPQKKMIRVKKIKPKKEKLVVVIPPPIMVRKKKEFRKERMLISVRARDIVGIAEKILKIVDQISDPSFSHPSLATASQSLLKTFASLLSLYRAITPVQFSDSLSNDAGKGMQLCNDTEWIQDQIFKICIAKQLDGMDLTRSVRRLGEMARSGRLNIIESQRVSLMHTLDGAHSFLYTSDPARYRDCENSIRGIVTELEELAKAWNPVMSSSTFYATIGGLVNSVLYRVLNEIEDQVDISEEESIKLNVLCKILHGLEGIFLEGEVSSVGREVPIWFKFVFLSELLEASMADILFLFDNSHLVDFTTSEIAKLVRALFSESPLRQKNLEHIMRGHPEVVEESY